MALWGFRAEIAPAVSATGVPPRQFCETPLPDERRRSGELASGSLPFTFTGDRFSAPCNNNNFGVQADMWPELHQFAFDGHRASGDLAYVGRPVNRPPALPARIGRHFTLRTGCGAILEGQWQNRKMSA
jgi:hypothetical protein